MTYPSIWYHELGHLMIKLGGMGILYGMGMGVERVRRVNYELTPTDVIKTLGTPMVQNALYFGLFPITVPFTILGHCTRSYNEDRYIEEDDYRKHD